MTMKLSWKRLKIFLISHNHLNKLLSSTEKAKRKNVLLEILFPQQETMSHSNLNLHKKISFFKKHLAVLRKPKLWDVKSPPPPPPPPTHYTRSTRTF